MIGQPASSTSITTEWWNIHSKDSRFIDDAQDNPRLLDLVGYDTNFNNKRKVMFESALASLIRSHPRSIAEPVNRVAQAVHVEIRDALVKEIDGYSLYHYLSHGPDILTEFNGEYGAEPPVVEQEKRAFIYWMEEVLLSGAAEHFYCQLLLIREFARFYLRPYQHFPGLQGQPEAILPEGIGKEEMKLAMSELYLRHRRLPEFQFQPRNERAQGDGRARLTKLAGIFDATSRYGRRERERYCSDISPHLPGKHLWRANSDSEFNRVARHILDMPLIAARSGSIALLLVPAIVLGKLDLAELRVFNLAAVSYMVSNGHHAIHEFKIVWETLDVPYTDGDYASLIPEGLAASHPELAGLLVDFSDLLQIEL